MVLHRPHAKQPHAESRPLPLSHDVSTPLAWSVLLALTALFVLLAVNSLVQKSVTVDEFGHLPAGFNLLRTADFGYCDYNPPLMNVLSSLPLLVMDLPDKTVAVPAEEEHRYSFWVNGYSFMNRHREHYHEMFVRARLVTVAAGAVLGWLAFLLARQLAPAGPNAAGLLAAGLVWLSPETLAHARLVTTDVGAAVVLLLSVLTFHRFLRSGALRHLILAGLALGLAQLLKFTCVYLYPALAVLAWVWTWRDRESSRLRLAGKVVGIFLLSLLVLNAGYLFQGTGNRLDSFALKSGSASRMQAWLPGWTPVLLPEHYVQGFDGQLADAESDEPSFLFGDRYTGGRWYFYVAILAIKTPIPLILLGLIAVAVAIRRRSGLFNHLLLLLPAGTILASFSFLSNHQVGIRLVLPATTLIWIWVATVLAGARRNRTLTAAIAGLLAWLAAETLLIHPDYLAYFNQLIGGPAQGHRYALDSNLDWGQDLPKLKRYMEEHHLERIQLLYFGRVDPAVYGIEYEVPRIGVRAGPVAVSTSLYGRGYLLNDHGALYETDAVPHLPGLFGKPVASLGHSIHVYDIQPRRQADHPVP